MSRANVNLNVVQAFSTQPTQVVDQYAAAPLTTFEMNTYYFTYGGNMQIPVAGPDGTPCRIVKVHAGCGKKIVTWTAERLGAWPEIPDPAAADPANEVLDDVQVIPSAPLLSTNGRDHEFKICGVYVYLLRTPPDASKGFKAGIAPNDKSSATNSVYPKTGFKKLFG